MANNTFEKFYFDMSSHELRIATTFAAAICMTLCCLVGLFGNIMSAIIFLHPLMRSPINVLLTGLSLIDLIMILLSIVVLIMPSLNLLLQNVYLWRAYNFTTVFLYPLCTAAHTSSIWTFVLVSIERWVAVCKPLNPHKLFSCRQARMAQTFVVVLALCYNTVRIWEYRDTSINSTDVPSGGVEPFLRVRIDYFISYYTVLYILTHFILPFSVILILNIFIIRSIRYSDRYLRERSLANSPGHHGRNAKQQRKTTNMIIVITLMFAMCNTCPFLLNIWEAMDPMLFYGPWQTRAYVALDLSNTFVLFNSSITFVIYIAYCRRYRVLFKYFVRFPGCFCGRNSTAGYDLACDPSFRRYSVVTNSEGGILEAANAAAFIFAKRTQHGSRNFSSMDVESFRSNDSTFRRVARNSRDRRMSAYPSSPEFRNRVFTQ